MKILDEIRHEVEEKMKAQCGKCIEKRYTKITKRVKEIFLYMVLFQGRTIKEAATELKINYSSAKTIIASFRNQFYLNCPDTKEKRRAGVAEIKDYASKNFKVQTYCQRAITNEYTLESFVPEIQKLFSS